MSVMDSNLRYRQLPTLSQLDVSSEVRFGPFSLLQADRGCAAVAFFGGSEGGVLKKRL
jgi:hypothetical protein